MFTTIIDDIDGRVEIEQRKPGLAVRATQGYYRQLSTLADPAYEPVGRGTFRTPTFRITPWGFRPFLAVPFLDKEIAAMRPEKWGCKESRLPKSTASLPLMDQSLRIPHLNPDLYPFQREGVCKIAELEGRVLLADEMGLGKTPQALQFLELSPGIRNVVVVCPASVSHHWVTEAKRWAPSWSLEVVGSSGAAPAIQGRLRDQAKTGLVCSWTMAQAALPDLGLPKGPEGCTLLICDEAHYAKNLEALRTRVVVSFSYSCTKVLLLTGTPMPNRASELFPLLHILRPGEFDSYTDFVDRFCILKSFSVGRSTITRVTGSKNLPQLRQILASHMLRRKKKQVLPQLPPKRWQQLLLPPDEVVVRASEELKEAANDPDNHTIIGLLAALRQKTGVAKVPAALEWIDNSSSPENPVVVFYHHRRVWRLISSTLRKKKISFVTIQGSTSQANRKKAVDTFQAGQTQVILVSTAGKEGITLTRAANLLKVERAWTPGDEAQLEDRIWRIGQKKPCLIVNLHLSGSTDDHIVGLLRRKSTDIRQTIEREIIERIRSANGYTYTGETP